MSELVYEANLKFAGRMPMRVQIPSPPPIEGNTEMNWFYKLRMHFDIWRGRRCKICKADLRIVKTCGMCGIDRGSTQAVRAYRHNPIASVDLAFMYADVAIEVLDEQAYPARPMTGLFSTLTPEQQKAVLANRDVDI